MVKVTELVAALDLEPVGEGRYVGGHADAELGFVFGGQLLAQAIVAAMAGHDGRTLKTLHTVFARAASPQAPLDIAVEPMHAGRALASATVTFSQGDRLCARAMALLTTPEPDFIHHADPAPAVAPPVAVGGRDEWEVEIAGGVDIHDPDAVGPAELDAWVRFPGAPDDPVVDQALLAFSTDGFLIATAMRPHAGVGQSQAHKTLSTGVLSHTITFHQPVAARGWLLLSHRSPFAGHGRSYGTANVFAADGTLAASFVQDGMIRPMGGDGPAHGRL